MHFQEVFSENTFGHTCPQIILFKKVQGQVAAEMFPFSLHIPSYKSICFAAHRLQSVPNRLVSRSMSSNIQKSNFADFYSHHKLLPGLSVLLDIICTSSSYDGCSLLKQ